MLIKDRNHVIERCNITAKTSFESGKLTRITSTMFSLCNRIFSYVTSFFSYGTECPLALPCQSDCGGVTHPHTPKKFRPCLEGLHGFLGERRHKQTIIKAKLGALRKMKLTSSGRNQTYAFAFPGSALPISYTKRTFELLFLKISCTVKIFNTSSDYFTPELIPDGIQKHSKHGKFERCSLGDYSFF